VNGVFKDVAQREEIAVCERGKRPKPLREHPVYKFPKDLFRARRKNSERERKEDGPSSLE